MAIQASAKLPEVRQQVANLADLTRAAIEAKASKSDVKLTTEQDVWNRVRQTGTFLTNKAADKAFDPSWVEQISQVGRLLTDMAAAAPEAHKVASVGFDRTAGDNLANELKLILSLIGVGQLANVKSLAGEITKAVTEWEETRPRHGGRGSASGEHAGQGARFTFPVRLTRNGEVLASERGGDNAGPTVQSIGVAALRAHRKARGIDPRDTSASADDGWKAARKDAFAKLGTDKRPGTAEAAEWTWKEMDAEATYRVERF